MAPTQFPGGFQQPPQENLQLDSQQLRNFLANTEQGMEALRQENEALKVQLQAILQALPKLQDVDPQRQEQAATIDQFTKLVTKLTERESKFKPLSKIQINKPSVYKGEQRDDACERWIQEVRQWIEDQELFYLDRPMYDDEKIRAVGSFTGDAVKSLWIDMQTDKKDPNKIGVPQTLDEFLAKVRGAYVSLKRPEQRRLEWDRLSQYSYGDAASYVSAVLNKARLLDPKPTDDDIRRRIQYGLHPRLQERLEQMIELPKALDAFASYVITLEESLHRASKRERNYRGGRQYSTVPTVNALQPGFDEDAQAAADEEAYPDTYKREIYEEEELATMGDLNAMKPIPRHFRGRGGLQRGRGRGRGRGYERTQERPRQNVTITCFTCQKIGHKSWECPDKDHSAPRINNMEEDEYASAVDSKAEFALKEQSL
jgi:hypothetical protein